MPARRGLLLAMILVGGALGARPVVGVAGEGHPPTAELFALNQRWNDAWLKKDAAAVEGMTASEYVYITNSGQVMNRDAVLAIVRSPGYRLDRGTRTEVVIRQTTQDVATLVYRWQGEGIFEGRSFKDNHRCTMVCVRRSSRWQVALEHCSTIGER